MPMVLAWSTVPIVLGIIIAVLLVLLVVTYFFGKRLQTKQEASQKQAEEMAQVASMLIIDKKRMKLKESGLPQMVIDQTPKYLRRSKVPVVKAKIGPKIMTLICEEKAFQTIPVKKEVKVKVSGIYIMSVISARGGLDEVPEKKGFLQKLRDRAQTKAK
ncbi:MAG: hypothetical protein K6G65_00705 [Lachnospiraceae bacterium]|nr:hypothetical protein [Lachnospiraceae bacterium]